MIPRRRGPAGPRATAGGRPASRPPSGAGGALQRAGAGGGGRGGHDPHPGTAGPQRAGRRLGAAGGQSLPAPGDRRGCADGPRRRHGARRAAELLRRRVRLRGDHLRGRGRAAGLRRDVTAPERSPARRGDVVLPPAGPVRPDGQRQLPGPCPLTGGKAGDQLQPRATPIVHKFRLGLARLRELFEAAGAREVFLPLQARGDPRAGQSARSQADGVSPAWDRARPCPGRRRGDRRRSSGPWHSRASSSPTGRRSRAR